MPATQTFDIRAFVPANEVEDLYSDEPYYLEPNGQAGVKAYALLRDALKDTGRIGVGTVVLRQREHVAAVEPSGEALVLSMMRFAHEIRSPKDFELLKEGEGWTKEGNGSRPSAHRHARGQVEARRVSRHLYRSTAQGDRSEGRR